MYQKTERSQWSGRVDSTNSQTQRFHQIIKFLDLSDSIKSSSSSTPISLLGFACDEGVHRNSGRPGASKGPEFFRKALANLACHKKFALYDAGDVFCPYTNLELAQEVLGEKVYQLLEAKYFPLVIGGGHEVSWGHFRGLEKFLRNKKDKKIGILNIDAHFDLRPYPEGPHSGSGFLQIADYQRLQGQSFHYMAVGIQEASNTKALFETAQKLDAKYILSEDCRPWNIKKLVTEVSAFIETVDYLYCSIDLDVFSAHLAPGVSATALNGIHPDCMLEIFPLLAKSKKLISLDIAELNPDFDVDNRTGKLAAYLTYKLINLLTS